MKLKDKKIEILENKVTVDKIGNHVKRLVPVATVWHYFRQLSGDEAFAAACVNVTENVLLQIDFLANITTAHVIRYKSILYDITRVDVFEGYKGDITFTACGKNERV